MINDFAARYLPDVDSFMRQVVDTFVPTDASFDHLIRYPLGWINAQGEAENAPVGKRIRPLLVLLSCEAAGGNWKTALPAAAAVEFLHNFSLIHDDIQDNSEIRRSRPTVWKIWGSANAINAGDAMFTLAYISLQQLTKVVPASITLKVWDTFNRTNLDLTRGQHLDMRFEQEQSITIDAYLSMIAGKSASLVAACAEIGALIGSGSETIARHFGAFGHNLGLAFQIRDDILGIWGDPAITGKSAATDILGRKKSLPVLFGLQRSERLAEIYRQDSLSENDVSEAVSVLNALGADSFAEQTEKQYFSEAIASLNAADVHGEAAATLRALASALLSRDR